MKKTIKIISICLAVVLTVSTLSIFSYAKGIQAGSDNIEVVDSNDSTFWCHYHQVGTYVAKYSLWYFDENGEQHTLADDKNMALGQWDGFNIPKSAQKLHFSVYTLGFCSWTLAFREDIDIPSNLEDYCVQTNGCIDKDGFRTMCDKDNNIIDKQEWQY